MRRNRIAFPLLLLLARLAGSGVLAAQATAPAVFRQDSAMRATVGENVPVSLDTPDRPHAEAWIAANPRDARHLLAVAIAFTRPDTSATCAAFASFDGGRTWRRSAELAGLEAAEFGFDPWAAFAPDGTAYASCLGAERPPGTATMLVYRSPDGGRTWGRPMPVPRDGGGGFDRGVVVADSAGRLYAAAVQGVTREGVRHVPAVLGRVEPGEAAFAPPLRFMPDVLSRQVLDVGKPRTSPTAERNLLRRHPAAERTGAEPAGSLRRAPLHQPRRAAAIRPRLRIRRGGTAWGAGCARRRG